MKPRYKEDVAKTATIFIARQTSIVKETSLGDYNILKKYDSRILSDNSHLFHNALLFLI